MAAWAFSAAGSTTRSCRPAPSRPPAPLTPQDPAAANGFGRDGGYSNGAALPPGEARLELATAEPSQAEAEARGAEGCPGRAGFGDLSIRRSTTAGSDGLGDDTAMADADAKKNGKLSEYFNLERPADVDEDAKVVSEFKGPVLPIKSELEADDPAEGAEWPYERLCDFLKLDLFDAQWETRHGRRHGLREIVRVHGAGAGRRQAQTRDENDSLNRAWLDDLACRLCCVLMLDRFTDYSSDTSVAPIRETVGQTLGSVLSTCLPAASIPSTASCTRWSCRTTSTWTATSGPCATAAWWA